MRSPLAVLAVAVALVGAAPAAADDSRKLQDAVKTQGILEHQAVLNIIGAAANGNRLAGAPGHDVSALYVGARAAAAGLKVSTHKFDYNLDFLADYKAPIMNVVSGGPRKRFVPGIAGAIPGGDFGSMFATQSTDTTAKVWAIDLKLPPGPEPNSNSSGCEAADFEGMPAGAIALVQRGTCTFAVKYANADAAGAGGVVAFNEGQPGRTVPQWFDVTGVKTPTVAATIPTAMALANGVQNGDTGLRARIRIDWRPGTYPTKNVIAETRDGDPNNVIVVGAHLDSVGTGPGINDNGSGSAAILEIAEQIRKFHPRNKIRFVWFSAEESGLLGSDAYVKSLPDAERAKIAAMLNFDMIGSPNFVRFVYDGDTSDTEPPPGGAPPGSAEIEKLFLDYFAGRGLPTLPTAFDGRSDYGPFIAVGVPAGGLFTGAEGIKTEEEARVFGGTAGQQYDPCYHLGCDTFFNLSHTGLDQMSDAAAHATITLAQAANPPARGAVATRSLQRFEARQRIPTPRDPSER